MKKIVILLEFLCIEWPKRVLVFVCQLSHPRVPFFLSPRFLFKFSANLKSNLRSNSNEDSKIVKVRLKNDTLGVSNKTQVCDVFVKLGEKWREGWREGCYLFTFSNIPVLITIIQ